jgi:FkbM family methyltransferase
LSFIKDNLTPTDNFLDLGAYRGDYIQFMLNFLPPQSITSVEMDKLTFNYLKNRFGNIGVKLLNLAISNKKGTIDYFQGCEGGCPNIFGVHENNSFVGPKIGVIETNTLDNIFLNMTFDIVKIDIEGAEIKALEGGIEILKKSRIIMIECHTDSEFPSIMRLLIDDIGKDVYCLKYFHKKTKDSPFSYQIVAIDKKYQIINGKIS